ncbi:MAG: very short patch repair endonuclease [Prevotellaceae bacterium]|jgi:DNA mismatch endonuclease (patch repair protein)|nr:very short patch repair endonuclease [Prevotellaceae bacterium]
MADVFTKDKRSDVMRKVKSSHNKSTELRLIGIFKKYRITGWRRNYKLFGKPDFTFPKNRIVVFVDGCFWHGHNCRNTKPQDNSEYWKNKQNRNINRDKEVTIKLQEKKWNVIRIWECDLKNEEIIKSKLHIFEIE